ncbi:bifunctional glycosyltransferase/CDP-glycerol:glycerophosphate glycerophosphotransferase [Pseudarthrobacter sp. S9]|uniref:bifunctional glycosyltransferase/CDP-glycerol:glycerophosphate glycerophosphotransferase n=1 Tax=Pseudarthrobacter sp. S9 TaxID=3418421 RepID=UPI003D06A892
MKEANTSMPGLNQNQAIAAVKAAAERKLRRAWLTLPKERRQQIRALVHPANVAKAKRTVVAPPGSHSLPPRVSVVVIVSDQAEDPSATLRSLVAQNSLSKEVIVADTSSSGVGESAVAPFTKRDSRMRYLALPGLQDEAARSTALTNCRAPHVMFLMAGDVLERASLELLVSTIRETGSDFAVGMAGIAKGKSATVPFWQATLHADPRLAVSLRDAPGILEDGFLFNKIFSRKFWNAMTAAVDSTRAHWQYEAIPFAYTTAASFDIVDVKVGNTLVDAGVRVPARELLCQTEFLEDRLARLESLAATIGAATDPGSYRRWLSNELGNGLFRFYEVIPRTDGPYWQKLQSTVAGLAAGQELQWDGIRVHNRLILAAVLSDSRDNVSRICANRSDYGSSFSTKFTALGLLAQPAYLQELSSFDQDLLVCRDIDVRLVSKLTHFEWQPDGRLEIGGYAYISSVEPSAGDLTIEASLVNASGTHVVTLDVERFSDSSIDWEANDNWTSYSDAGFRTVLNPSLLLDEVAGQDTAEWHVQLTVTAHDRRLEGPIARRDLNGSTGQLGIGPMQGTSRVAVEMRPATTGLTFVGVTPLYIATSLELTGRSIELTVEAHSAPLAAKVSVECRKLGIRKTATCITVDANTATYQVDVPPLGKDASLTTEYEWELRLDSGFKTPQPVAWQSDSRSLENRFDSSRSLRLGLTGYGFLKIEERKTRIVATSVELSPDRRTLLVAGTADLPRIHAPRFVLSSGKSVIPARDSTLMVRTNDGSNRFTAEFALPQRQWKGEELMPESGAYSVRYVPPGAQDDLGYWFPAAPELQELMPRRIDAGRTEVGISRSSGTAALTIHLRPPLSPEEQGRFNQQLLRTKAADGLNPELTNAILFMCFGGRRATDSPRRLLEEFQRRGTDWPTYWAISDFSVPVPPGTTPVLIGSALWYQLLGEVKILINNNNFPFYFRKREGQVYIQTWHGTPLKKLGNDVARTSFSLSYWNLMWREAEYWDSLLAQNDYAAEVLANCFGFHGQVVAEGYPRNDSLTAERMDTNRLAIRQRLGIPEGKTAILYAPTWRDDAKSESKQYEMVTYLDFETAQQQLGGDYVLLLRGHHNIASQRQTAANKFVIDVTEYPEVNDLYTAADILVNDYSSVMFDFCVTGKPIIFLTPDIAQYRDSTRGFYFDLEEKAPGPLHNTTEEVVRSIKNISSVSRRYAPKYREFVATFAPQCDGEATQRVFDALWPDGLTEPMAVGSSHSSSQSEY